ncbi:MAG TPA: ABC-F family ATP-binding cassette domain-containing protein [Chloroflexota bacterium]|nr:ABC-F family ATP-binding cassette domain-containing protein [Chloroflexota bacterium]
MLRILNLKKSFGGQDVLKDVSFEIGDRDKVALVGPNGAGKSSLLKIVAGELHADEGVVRLQGGASSELAYLPQDAGVRSGRSLWDEMLSSFPELQRAQAELTSIEGEIGEAAAASGDERLQALIDRQGTLLERFEELGGYGVEAEVAKVLAGLGFQSTDRDKQTIEFSGGWQMRIALAKMLVRKPGVLLLDEPTNHLDLSACEWLEGYLAEYPGLILVVSHDRYFLDRVTDRTIELTEGVASDFRGNYTFYLAESARRRAEQKAAYDRQQKYIARQTAFINATKANAARAAMAKSRERALAKLERLPAPRPEQQRITVKLATGKRAPDRVLTADGINKSFDAHDVLRGLSLAVDRGDRIALVGPNGAGKSTLLRVLAGIDAPTKGKVVLADNVEVGYYAQDQSQTLEETRSVVDEVLAHAPNGWGIESVRGLLARFLFTQDDVFKLIGALSGGEKSRLSLAKLLLKPRQLLLLDEPTNHLDVPSKDEVEKALNDYAGAVIFSSHDRFLLDRVATKVAELEDGKLKLYHGGWTAYREAKGELPMALAHEQAQAAATAAA